MTEPTTSTPDTAILSDQSDYISKLESQNVRSQREIVALSRLLIETSLATAPAPIEVPHSAEHFVDDTTWQSMFRVMALTLHLTRVPIIMRFNFFKRRHQTRLAKALKDRQLIDPEWYANTYPDVVESGQDPILYFVTKGIEAGHMPHPKFAKGVSA